MIDYLKQYVEKSINPKHGYTVTAGMSAIDLLIELDKLDPRDFEPSAQCDFLLFRSNQRHYANNRGFSVPVYNDHVGKLPKILDQYRGEGSFGVSRRFLYLHDPELQSIVERDYLELSIKLFPAGAWKTVVIMAGSVLEAILTDVLTNPRRITNTLGSNKAPPNGDINRGDWKLEKF